MPREIKTAEEIRNTMQAWLDASDAIMGGAEAVDRQFRFAFPWSMARDATGQSPVSLT